MSPPGRQASPWVGLLPQLLPNVSVLLGVLVRRIF